LHFIGNWVIYFDNSVLETLQEWHQKTFADKDAGGNGLFADVLKSKLTKDEVEEDLLALLKHYCPEKKCPLAGSSIHIDKEVLKLRMPTVHAYLHYRIIDVSSFQGIMKRRTPWIERDIKKRLAKKGQETVNHRAMDDIEWSISFMREFRPILTKQHG
jgi:oligoribonuclease